MQNQSNKTLCTLQTTDNTSVPSKLSNRDFSDSYRNKKYNVGIYIRLSAEDVRKKISNSIGTQKEMLLGYLQTQPDMELYGIYEDVNYTGTNYNRPGFKKMLDDIQAGIINCIIVKDLSRFGRNFGETGNFLERVFPFLQLRFISVGDGYDSLTASIDDSSLIVPLKNLINEVYARDISKKVQSSVQMKQKRGEFCGGIAPYGYINDGKSFLVDEEAAVVVRQIFGWILEGLSDYKIAEKLNELTIMPPSRYRFEKGITKARKHKETKFWYKSAVQRISENPAYTGVLAQGKQRSTFLKGGKYEMKNRSEWIIIENTHKAIIDKEVFESVRKIRDSRKKCNKTCIASDNKYKGLIFCADCGAHMTRKRLYHTNDNDNDKYYFSCNTYVQVAKHACTKKKIIEADINEALILHIKSQINLTADIRRIILNLQKQADYRQQHNLLNNQIKTLQIKLQKNRRFRLTLREDYKDGVISELDYTVIKSDCDSEDKSLRQELETLLLEKLQSDNTFFEDSKGLTELRRFEAQQYLSREMISALIERINVSDNARIDVLFRYRDEFEALKPYIQSIKQEAKPING